MQDYRHENKRLNNVCVLTCRDMGKKRTLNSYNTVGKTVWNSSYRYTRDNSLEVSTEQAVWTIHCQYFLTCVHIKLLKSCKGHLPHNHILTDHVPVFTDFVWAVYSLIFIVLNRGKTFTGCYHSSNNTKREFKANIRYKVKDSSVLLSASGCHFLAILLNLESMASQ